MALSMLQCKRIPQGKGLRPMIEIVRTNDLVLIGFLQSLLENANIPVLVADAHMNALEGMIGAFPRRILVPEDYHPQARRLIADAGLESELRHD
jgi:Putative prokaryotic signal transducing protein